MSQGVEKRVKELLAEYSAFSVDEIKLTHSISKDLSIEGDDAIELFQRLSLEFNLNLSNFDVSEYFVSEAAFEPLRAIFEWLFVRKDKKKEFTVQDVIKLVESSPRINGVTR